MVRKSFYNVNTDSDEPEIFMVPRNCIYLSNWKHLQNRCRQALLTWCCCAKKLGIIKDIEYLIAQEIWNLRDEPEWE